MGINENITAETTAPSPAAAPASDPGLTALVMLLRFLGVPADPEQIRHQTGDVIGTSEMLRCIDDAAGIECRKLRLRPAQHPSRSCAA